jgi:UDP-2-acetamido-2-deoxy-ribo-hexuluronate aminotransferase
MDTPTVSQGNVSAWAQYTVRVRDRDKLQLALKEKAIPTAVYYPMPLNCQPAVADDTVTLPEGDLAAEQVLSLPVHAYLSEKDIDQIVAACSEAMA